MPLNTSARIDQIIIDWLGLPLDAPNVVDEWRPTIMRALQTCLALDVWPFADWNFKRTSAVVVVTSGTGPLPDGFLQVGSRGNVYVQGQTIPLTFADGERIIRERRAAPSATGYPEYYGIYGTNIEVEKSVSYSLDLFYEGEAPTLVDGIPLDPDPDVQAGFGLETIPNDVQEALVMGAIDRLSVGAGDGRGASELSPRLRRALADAAARRVDGLESTQQLADRGVSEFGMW